MGLMVLLVAGTHQAAAHPAVAELTAKRARRYKRHLKEMCFPTMASFNGKRLPPISDGRKFEIFTLDLWERLYGKGSATLFGRSGQAQDGVDVLVRAGDRLIGVQCKAVAKLDVEVLEEEVGRARGFVPSLTHFVLVTTAPHDTALVSRAAALTKDHLAQGGFEVAYFGWDELLRLLEDHADVARKHFPEFTVPTTTAPTFTIAVDNDLKIPMTDSELALFCSEAAWHLREQDGTVFRVEQEYETQLLTRLQDPEIVEALDEPRRWKRAQLREELAPVARRIRQLETAMRILLTDPNVRSPWLIGGCWDDTARVMRRLVPQVVGRSASKPAGLSLKASPTGLLDMIGHIDLDAKERQRFTERCEHFTSNYYLGNMADLDDELALSHGIPAAIAGLVRYAYNHDVPIETLQAEGRSSIYGWMLYLS